MATYFSYFPNVYVGEGINDDEAFRYRLVKNIFRRMKVREDLKDYITLTELFTIEDGDRPSDVAARFYSDPFLDWVILLANNITDIYEEWPIQQELLYDRVKQKYDEPDAIHHWETNKILLDDGEVYMRKGIVVNESFRTVMPDGTEKNKTESIYPVSNYEHEEFENEKKRFISLPTPPIVELMLTDIGQKLAYEPHPELDIFGDKKTESSIIARFLDQVGYVSGSVTVSQGAETVSSYDFGPTASGTVGTVTSTAASTTTSTTTPTPTPTPAPTPTPTPTPSPTPSGGGGGYSGGY